VPNMADNLNARAKVTLAGSAGPGSHGLNLFVPRNLELKPVQIEPVSYSTQTRPAHLISQTVFSPPKVKPKRNGPVATSSNLNHPSPGLVIAVSGC
jgi:hypothetical protein